MRFTTAVSTFIAVLFSIAVANAAIMIRDNDTVADGPGEGDSAPTPPVEPLAHEATANYSVALTNESASAVNQSAASADDFTCNRATLEDLDGNEIGFNYGYPSGSQCLVFEASYVLSAITVQDLLNIYVSNGQCTVQVQGGYYKGYWWGVSFTGGYMSAYGSRSNIACELDQAAGIIKFKNNGRVFDKGSYINYDTKCGKSVYIQPLVDGRGFKYRCR